MNFWRNLKIGLTVALILVFVVALLLSSEDTPKNGSIVVPANSGQPQKKFY